MLKQPTRPRAPSAATLRVLYQLAYISSGTALGVGALCAEERRRRTQLVQKIADNAKRIRQHPRYRHNTALAVAGDGEDIHYEPFLHSSDGFRNQDGAILGPQLPSIIEHAYTYTVERDAPHTRPKRRKLKDSNSRSTTIYAPTSLSSYVGEPIRPPVSVPAVREQRLGTATDKAHDGLAIRRAVSPATVEPRRSTVHSPSSLTVQPQAVQPQKAASSQDDDIMSLFKSRQFWARTVQHDFWKTLSRAEKRTIESGISSDVAKLFQLLNNKRAGYKLTLDEADKMARPLLLLAVELGQLRDATSLLLWKVAVARVTDADIRLLAHAYLTFKRLGRSWEVGIRGDDGQLKAFKPLSAAKRALRSPGSQAKDGIAFEAGAHQPILATFVNAPCLRFTLPTVQICASVVGHCRDLAQAGFLGAAVYMMTAVPLRDWAAESITQLTQDLFRAAMQSSQLQLCDLLLRWTGGCLSNHYISKVDINAFIDSCGNAEAHIILSSMFSDPSYHIRSNACLLLSKEVLNASNFLQLCYTFANGPTRYFEQCYKQLSDDQRKSYRENQLSKKADAWKSQWSTTRNFAPIWADYGRTMDLPHTEAVQEHTVTLQLTMIRICLAAGETQSASDIFATIRETNNDTDIYLITMLACAHASDWSSLDTVLDLVPKHTPDDMHLSTMKRILELYAHDHDASKVQDLCIRILDACELTPTATISTFVLQQAVAEQRHDLFYSWFKKCRERKWQMNVNAELAFALLHKHAVVVRPDHAMVMGTAHTISKLAPALAGNLGDVVREAITHDIRMHSHRRAAWQLKNATARLMHLNKASGHIPHPGVVWNQKLTLYDHNEIRSEGYPKTDELSQPDPSTKTTLQASPEEPEESIEWFDQYDADAQVWPMHNMPTAAELNEDKIETVSANIELPHRNEHSGVRKASGPQSSDKRKLRLEMRLLLNTHRYKDAMSLYRDSCSAAGLPHSAALLEMALEASLRMHESDPAEANAMLSAAKAAGMNIGTVMAPLLTHRLKAQSRIAEADIPALKTDVLIYYRTNAQSGRHVSHDLAVTVADKIIADGLPKQGIALLRAVSESGMIRSFDVVAYTVWIKGYALLRDVSGICSLVDHILATNMRIDQMLIWTLKMAECGQSVLGNMAPTRPFSEHDVKRLRDCRERCRQRRAEQKEKVTWYLPKLAFSLVKLWRHQTYGPASRHHGRASIKLRRATRERLCQLDKHKASLQVEN